MSLFVVNSSVSPPPSGTASASPVMPDAIIPSSLARVSVTQQSPQQLTLRLPGGTQLTLDTARLPGATTTQQYRTASLPDTNQSAALFSVNQNSTSVAVSDSQLSRLTDQITRLYTTAANAQLSIKAQVTAVRPEAISLQLNNGQTLTIPARLSPTHNIGEQVTLDLTRQEGKTTLSVKGANTQGTLVATLVSPDKSVVRDVVSGALSNAGIRLDAKAIKSLPDAIAALVAKPQGQTMQHQITVAERGGKLNVQSATLQAIGRFPVPAPVSAASLGKMTGTLADLSALNRLPMLNVSDTATTKMASIPASADNLSAQQRSDVHQQIITLSRQLLSETGSTRTALNQLLSALDMPAKGMSPATQGLLTTLQTRVRGLEQGVTFSSFIPQPKSDSSRASATLQNSSSNVDAKPGNLLGNMAQRVKDIASLLSQPGTLQDAGDAAQSKSATPGSPLPQTPGEQVKALLNTTPLPLSQAVLSRPGGGNDLVGALVTMLQFSLAGRAINRHPSLARQADRSDSLLSKSLAGGATAVSGSPSRVAQDISQMDSRGSLVQSLKTLLSNHQQASLINADNRLQGQDSLYYMLPTTGSNTAPPELLIRRDQSGSGQEGEQQSTSRNWHLTMKLDIGEVGELLAKSRISGETIELDLYASSDQLLQMVADSLVYFTRRLEANGLNVARTSFQRGKVPSTLREQPHHIFETMV